MDADGPVAVVLVHGIGEQRRGGTLAKFLRGVSRQLFGQATVERRPALDRALLQLPGRRVRVYETWWAETLGGERVDGTFDPLELPALAWFPWLNQRFGYYRPSRWVRTVVWTILLAPAMFVLQIPLLMVRGPGRLQRLLDRILADVTNYVASAGKVTFEASPVWDAAVDIQRRFAATLEEAADDGCSEILVVAHSLGSVIAYHGLSGGVRDDAGVVIQPSAKARALVRTLITIGSPLEKIRWMWPPVVTARMPETVAWHNMRDRLDPVAGKLRHFGAVADHAVIGRANLASAHTAYEQNPRFMRLLLGLLGLGAVKVRRTPLPRRIGMFAMSLSISVFLVGVALFVVVALVLIAAVFAGLIAASQMLDMNILTGPMSLELIFIISFVASVVLLVGMTVGYGWNRANLFHEGFRLGSGERGDDGGGASPEHGDSPAPVQLDPRAAENT